MIFRLRKCHLHSYFKCVVHPSVLLLFYVADVGARKIVLIPDIPYELLITEPGIHPEYHQV